MAWAPIVPSGLDPNGPLWLVRLWYDSGPYGPACLEPVWTPMAWTPLDPIGLDPYTFLRLVPLWTTMAWTPMGPYNLDPDGPTDTVWGPRAAMRMHVLCMRVCFLFRKCFI